MEPEFAKAPDMWLSAAEIVGIVTVNRRKETNFYCTLSLTQAGSIFGKDEGERMKDEVNVFFFGPLIFGSSAPKAPLLPYGPLKNFPALREKVKKL